MNSLDFLLDNPLFEALRPFERASLLTDVEMISKKAGEQIFSAKTTGSMIYYIISGKVDLETDGKHIILENMHFVGWDAFYNNKYNATCMAHTDVTLLAISAEKLKELYDKNPSFQEFLFKYLLGIKVSEDKKDKKSKVKETRGTNSEINNQIIGWFLTLITPALIYSLTSILQVSEESRIFLSIVSTTIVMWTYRLFNEFIPGVFLILGVLAFNIAPIHIVLGGLASETFVLMMSVFVLSMLITNSGLVYRLFMWLYNQARQTANNFVLIMFFAGMLLTPMVPSILSRCQLVAPVLVTTIKDLKIPLKGTLSTQLATSAFFGASIFSSVILNSSLMNFVVLGLLPEQEQNLFQWWGWLRAAALYGGLTVLGYGILTIIFFRGRKDYKVSSDLFQGQLNLLGKVRPEEWVGIISAILLTIGLLTTAQHKIHPSYFSLILMFAILCFQYVSKEDFHQYVDWPFLLFLASAISIVSIIKFLGLDQWISSVLSGFLIIGSGPVAFLIEVALVTVLLRLILPIAPSVILLNMAFIPLAYNNNVSPWLASFIILVMSDLWFFPYQNHFYLKFEEMSHHNGKLIYDQKKFLVFNAICNVMRFFALYLSVPYWRSLGLM